MFDNLGGVFVGWDVSDVSNTRDCLREAVRPLLHAET